MRASKEGIEIVDERRIKRGWSRSSEAFVQEAGIRPATLKRFWGGREELKKESLIGIFRAVGIQDWQKYVVSTTAEPSPPPSSDRPLDDGVPECPIFYGRSQELETLSTWVLDERNRVVALLGIGGIGKTTLAIKLTEYLRPHFDGVIWRSLRSAPPLSEFLADLLETITPSESLSSSRLLSQLTEQLQRQRLLLVFDGWEDLLGGESAGTYRPEYQAYSNLLSHLGQQQHQSCLILTSREKQAYLTLIGARVGAYVLQGLEVADACQLLNRKGLRFFDPHDAEELVKLYRGNPLALQLIASKIRDQFGGNIAEFLKQDTVLADAYFTQVVLEQQTRSLSDLERQMLCTLAQDPQPIDREALRVRFPRPISASESINILDSLERRSLVERRTEAGQVLFSLQPLVRQHVQRHLQCQ